VIPVSRVEEPGEFDVKVRIPGNNWLARNQNLQKRPPAYWSKFTPELGRGFKQLCGYAAMLVPADGTVDHFLSIQNLNSKKRLDLVYEWSNYRFASAALNSCKKNADQQVLDPYKVKEGWFEILLPSLIMRTTNAIPEGLRNKADYTLRRLKLDHGAMVIRWRQSWYDLYMSGDLSLDGLRKVAPLIAAAVDKALAKNRAVP
jgi:hypothetical protein